MVSKIFPNFEYFKDPHNSELLYFIVPNWKKVFRFWTFFLSIFENHKVDSGKKCANPI